MSEQAEIGRKPGSGTSSRRLSTGTPKEPNDNSRLIEKNTATARIAHQIDSNGERQYVETSLREGYVWKLGRKLTGRPKWRKRYFVCTTQALLFVYKTKEEYLSRRDLPEKVVRIDTPDGYMVDTGRISSNGVELYLNTLCHQSLTTGELKELKFGSQQPEDAYHWRSVILSARQGALNKREAREKHTPRPASKQQSKEGSPIRDGSTSSPDEAREPRGTKGESSGSTKRSAPKKRQISHGTRPSALDHANDVAKNAVDTANKPGFSSSPNALDRSSEMSIGYSATSRVDSSGFTNRFGRDVAEEKWKLTKVENGLRFFQQQCGASGEKMTVPHNKALVCVRCPPDSVFKLIMDISPSRADWDITFAEGEVVETRDGHTDVIRHEFAPLSVWSLWPQPWARDLCLQRYWRREEDGTYMILMCSTEHPACPPKKGVVRACMVGGGFIIQPIIRPGQAEPDSLVIHMLEMMPYGWIPSNSFIATSMFHQILLATGALREGAEQLNFGAPDLESFLERGIPLKDKAAVVAASPEREDEDLSSDDSVEDAEEEEKAAKKRGGLEMNNVSEQLEELSNKGMPSLSFRLQQHHRTASEVSASANPSRASSNAADFCSLAGKHGNMPMCQWPPKDGDKKSVKYWGWCESPVDQYRVRSKKYLLTKQKNVPTSTQMQLVATDWFKCEKRMDNVAGRKGSIVQKHLLKDPRIGLVFAVNIQVPAQQQYSMLSYFAMPGKLDPNSLLGKFVNDPDDTFRNVRFKLIPVVCKGPWVVQKTVGTTPLIVGGALKVNYHRGERYFEVDIDIGSSAVANSVVRFVFGYARYIVVDMAYLIQGNTEAELPEELLGTLRVAHLDLSAAVDPPPAEY